MHPPLVWKAFATLSILVFQGAARVEGCGWIVADVVGVFGVFLDNVWEDSLLRIDVGCKKLAWHGGM